MSVNELHYCLLRYSIKLLNQQHSHLLFNFFPKILEDSVFENQSSAKFQRVCRVKADGAVHLDLASRKLCPDLHLWVTFSSVACGKGNAGKYSLVF